MKVIETKVYTIDELSENAKRKARDWWCSGLGDDDWYETTIEEARTIGAMLGFEIGPHDIAFAGFSSQGDGASFSGRWRYARAPVTAIKSLGFSGKVGEDLESIAVDMRATLQGMTRDEIEDSFTITRSGRYCHERTMQCDHEGILAVARDFARWIYRQLETEWDYLNSDEQVDETIRANEYTFTEDGSRFG